MRARPLLLSCWWFLLIGLPPARADRVEDLARIHIEVMGGRARIDALSRLRAVGQVNVGGNVVRFTMLATRPAKIRIETEGGGRKLVQGSDGAEPPWELDRSVVPPKYRDMPAAAAKTFVSDAEFDNPLIAGAARGYVFDYAGELVVDGRKVHRLLVTRHHTESFSLLIDDETYLISKRIEQRTSAGGRKLQVVTHYEDFRPVDGVLYPHKITLAIDGRATQQTRITRIEGNPVLHEDNFRRPPLAPLHLAPAERPAGDLPPTDAGPARSGR